MSTFLDIFRKYISSVYLKKKSLILHGNSLCIVEKNDPKLKISQKDDYGSFQCHTGTLTGLTKVNSFSKEESLNWNTTEIGGLMIFS